MSSRVLNVLVLLCLFAGSASPAGATASLVADVNQVEPSEVLPAVLGPFVPLGNKVLFVAEEPGSGRELWVSDGTSLGTEILRDFCPGRCGASFGFLGTLRERIAIILALDQHDRRLWRSDGTRQGTSLLSPDGIRPLATCPRLEDKTFVFLGGVMYFSGELASSGGCDLWRTDGTREGTRLVRAGEPHGLTPAGHRFFFWKEGLDETELWVSNGTSEATTLLQTWSSELEPRLLTAVGSKLLFIAPDNGEELWVSDGTPAGTKPITSFAAPEPFRPTGSVEVFDGVAYFLVDDVTDGVDLWRSDGTRTGTRRVTAFGYATPFPSEILELARIGNRLVFVASDGLTGQRLWTSRGTPETTAPIPCTGVCPELDLNEFSDRETELVVIGDRLLFAAEGNLWSTNGSSLSRVRIPCPGGCSIVPGGFTVAGGSLFFATWASGPTEIWKSDGTSSGTVRLATLRQSQIRDEVLHLAQAGGRLFFAAESEGRPLQLWTSDGTAAGSAPVTVIGLGEDSDPSSFTSQGDQLFFRACSGSDLNLWRSDGTPAGTAPVDLGQSHRCSFENKAIESLTASGGFVFFKSDDILWRTDGTPGGTVRLTDTVIEDLVPFGTGVAFSAFSGNSLSLWTSDGTVAGTLRRFDRPHTFSILGAFGPDLYFTSSPSDGSPAQLLATNGTPAGTRVVATLEPFFGTLSDLTRIGNRFFFIVSRINGLQVWTADGTPGGTRYVPLAASPGDLSPSSPRNLEVLGDTLYALALSDPVSLEEGPPHVELWRIDGATAEVSRVREVAPAHDPFGPFDLVSAGRRLYFPGNDGEHGVELWESDGTAAGTRMVEDVAPGPSSSYPGELTPAGDRLHFAADDGVHGREPWVLRLSGTACQPSEFVLCLGGGRFKVEADWRDFDGNTGRGRAVSLTTDTGYFWFFSASNVEVILKVLDGRGVNGHHWVFYGALSTVRYVLTVTDTQTGAARRYINPPGLLGSVGDTQALGPLGATGSGLTIGPEAVAFAPLITHGRSAKEGGTCAPSSTRLCLNGGRFAVEARWRDFDGNRGNGMAVPLSGGDTGYFWFFNQDNVEVVLKVLDGRPVNDRFWVFYGALSSVEYTLTVTDTMTGARKVYTNPSGRLASGADTSAF
jgi:ELWxxDGT repeat protein